MGTWLEIKVEYFSGPKQGQRCRRQKLQERWCGEANWLTIIQNISGPNINIPIKDRDSQVVKQRNNQLPAPKMPCMTQKHTGWCKRCKKNIPC